VRWTVRQLHTHLTVAKRHQVRFINQLPPDETRLLLSLTSRGRRTSVGGKMDLLSELQGTPLSENVPSLWERFGQAVDAYPDHVALACTHQPSELYGIPSQPLQDDTYHQQPYLRWTYRSLKDAVDRLVDSLQVRGVRKGMPYFVFMANTAEYVVAYWAANRLGCVHVPINPRNLLNKEEAIHMIETVLKSRPSEPAIIFADSSAIANQLNGLGLAHQFQTLIVVSSEDVVGGWLRFSDLMTPLQPLPQDEEATYRSTDDSVFFTSGTSSLPKGCAWTYPGTSVIIDQRKDRSGFAAGDVCCIVVPNNHGIGYVWMISSLCAGATLVFPGPAFAPQIMMETLQRERCTHTAMVPTMIRALLGVQTHGGGKLNSMKSIFLGGTMVSPEIVRHCIEDLGSAAVENGYGMTEGVFIFSGDQPRGGKIIRGEFVSVGKVMAGTKIRVCAPNDRKPLPRGELGELHYSGPSLLRGYMGKQSEDFYVGDDGRLWFVTGDQARIDHEELVYIVGRYKETIIRGGENISPAAVEFVINRVPKLAALNVQVLGAPDPIAGEVPIAVVERSLDPDTAQELYTTVLTKMGPAFVPDEVLSLDTLGLKEYPKTMAGKIQKVRLAAIVRKYRDDKDSPHVNGSQSPDQLNEIIKSLWRRALGHPVDENVSISDFADSITLMKVRDRISKETGRSLTLAEMVDANTIAGQIKLLKSQSTIARDKRRLTQPRHEGPPTVDDMVHLASNPELLDGTKALLEKVLAPYDLGWQDVEDILPAYDFGRTLAQTGIFDSWNLKFALLPKRLNVKQLRTALEATLSRNRILASFLIWDRQALTSDVALHVVIRHHRKHLDLCILDHGKIKTLNDLNTLAMSYPFPGHATVPGPLIRALLVHVEETNSAAMLINVHHAVLDASYGQLFFEDLDRALAGAELDDHVDYKVWADSYFALRTSSDARVAVAWHVRRLDGLHCHRKALFPPPTATGGRHFLNEGEGDGVEYSFRAPGVLDLRRRHRNITSPIILKSALALLNVHRTGHTHALFANLEAARTRFPFIPKALETLDGQGYEASDVAGPTIQTVTNLVEIKPEESTVAFLERVQEDQNNLTKYASAPLHDIITNLGAHAGPMVLDVLRAQIFNWVPGMGTTGTTPFSNFECVSVVARPDIGLAINAGMGGENGDTIFLHLRGIAFSKAELLRTARDLEKITCWMADEKHRDAPVGRYHDCLDQVNEERI